MKKYLRLLSLTALSLSVAVVLASCNPSTPNSSATKSTTDSSLAAKTVSSLAMKTNPTKLDYYVGDTFDPAGGVVTISYSDSTSEDVALSDTRFEVTAPSMDSAGKKNVIVKLSGKRVTFQVNVTVQQFTVTFDYNYTGSTPTTVKVDKGTAVAKPTDPTRDGYAFDAWYSDSALSSPYDFASLISKDFTLYAKWTDTSKATYTFTFDLNYYGVKPSKTTQKIEDGNTATRLATDPTRKGYVFDNWYTDTALTTAFDFSTAIKANTTVYAKWTRSTSELTGTQTYLFEAEDVSLKGMTGKGLSGTVTEKGMILTNKNCGASNDKFVGYLYKAGLTLDFEIASDVAVTASISVRFSEEVEAYTYNKDNYAISLNGTAIDYPAVSYAAAEVPATNADTPYAAFKDFTISTASSLKAGNNYLHLTTSNFAAIAGTTMEAHAPLVDCVKITVDNAVLGWDGTYDLPAKNY